MTMGLDVYLERCEDRDAAEKAERAYEAASEAASPYEDGISAKEKTKRTKDLKVLAGGLGLDEWGSHESRTSIRRDSKIDPGHLFKIGYFRSSYNEGGINRILENMGCPSLYDIFQPGDEYEFHPDWGACMERATAALERFKRRRETLGDVTCFFVSAVNLCEDAKDALKIYEREKQRNSSFSDYSNADGLFGMNGGMTVYAVIPGKRHHFESSGAYLVCRGDLGWYEKALEIVLETCEWVAVQDSENYYLRWSS